MLSTQKFLRIILGKIANFIKQFLPKKLSKSWGLKKYYLLLLPKVDSKTVIAPRHIEPSKGVPGSWQKLLSKDEISIINKQYKEYLKIENYIS